MATSVQITVVCINLPLSADAHRKGGSQTRPYGKPAFGGRPRYRVEFATSWRSV